MKATAVSMILAAISAGSFADDNADALKSMRQAIQACQADLDRPKVASVPREMTGGKWAKSIDTSRSVKFDVQTTNSLVTPTIAMVDVTIEFASVIADTEEAAKAIELASEPAARSTQKMRFGWQGGRWVALEGGRNEASVPPWRKIDWVPLPVSSVGAGKSVAARCARIIMGRPATE